MTEWAQFSGLTPRLRPHVHIHRHEFRGQRWYVLQNHSSGRFHRVSPAAYPIVGQFNGDKTLAEIVVQLRAVGGLDGIEDGDIVQLMKQLYLNDLLQNDQPVASDFFARRIQALRQHRGLRRFLNPLALRIPLVDPDAFLERTLGAWCLLFSRWGMLLWLAVVTTGLVLAGMHWAQLTDNITDRVLSTGNLLIIFVVFPLIKAMHELGHGYAIKRWGGEVHEMGVMFLVFMPIPYVDASSASGFRHKRQRMLVGAGGMVVELFLASLAMILWANVEPGMVRAIAFNVILVASISTLLFNGNPLLRYDGYYVLADWLEIPNLGNRANQYIGYLFQRYLFGAAARSPVSATGERFWFVSYGVASFFYRLFVWVAIILFVATKFFFFGVLLAIWGSALMFGKPLMNILKYLAVSPALEGVRGRALLTSSSLAGLGILALLALPIPYATLTEGVVWLPEGAVVRAQADGFVSAIAKPAQSDVKMGDELFVMHENLAAAKVRLLDSQVKELQAEYDASMMADRVRADIFRAQLGHLQSRLAKAREEMQNLVVYSDHGGVFVPLPENRLLGRFVNKGDILGYVVGDHEVTVRTVVPQQDYELVASRIEGIQARVSQDLDAVVPLKLVREVPAASDRLPSRALSTEGGGDLFLDPSDPDGRKTLGRHFELELKPLRRLGLDSVGGRVYVRFDHGNEAVAFRIYRGLRQLLLSRFSI